MKISTVSFSKIKEIINKSDNKINHAIWLLEMEKYKIKYDNNWMLIIELIFEYICLCESKLSINLFIISL